MAFTIKMPTGKRITVESDSALIGRDSSCQVVLKDSVLQPIHAKIRKVANRWMIESEGDWKIQVGSGVPGRMSWVKSGDVIRLTESGPVIAFDEAMPILDLPVPAKTPCVQPPAIASMPVLPLDTPVSRFRSAELQRPKMSAENGPSPSPAAHSMLCPADPDEQNDFESAPCQRGLSSKNSEPKYRLATRWAQLTGKQKAGVIGGGVLIFVLIVIAASNSRVTSFDPGGSGASSDTSLPSVSGRVLKVTVNRAGIGHLKTNTGSLTSLKCVATEDQVVIDFDIDTSQWVLVHEANPLLVRLFDKNGQYLTHFTTVEGFTLSDPAFQHSNSIYQSLMKNGNTDVAKEYKCVLLKPKGNRFVYPVNVRDLRDARIVEIGFIKR